MTLQRRRRIGNRYSFQRAEDGVFVAVEAASWEEAEPLAREKLEESERDATATGPLTREP